VSGRSLHFTWAWLWAGLAALLLATGVTVIAVIALSGRDSGEVALAVLLIGFPAVLGALALFTMALIMARPSGAGWRTVRRWSLALLGGVAVVTGIYTFGEGASGAVPLTVAGLSALAFLALDLWRARREG
jgi:heme/copper-type cytochrome/quinol oxidase subunit 4